MKALAKKSTANQRKEHNIESAFTRLQRCRSQYGSIFIRLAVVASQIGEISRNCPKTQNL